MVDNIKYKFRKSVLEPTKTLILNYYELVVLEKEVELFKIPYKNIKTIRIYYKPQRYRPNNYECCITYGNSSYRIKSTSYNSVGNFSDLSHIYIPFVEALVAKVFQTNSKAKLFAGNTNTTYWFYVFISTITVLGLAILFLMLPLPGGFGFILGILMVVYYLFYSLKMFIKNYPIQITDGNIPDKVLPKR